MFSVTLERFPDGDNRGLLSRCPVLTARSRPNTEALAGPGSASSACSPVIGQEDGGEEAGICFLPGQQTSGI